MSQRAILVFPKFEKVHLIQELRQQFDPLAHIIEPHITLVFPFESQLSTEDLQSHLHGAVQGLNPFPILLRGITGSESEYLFLNVKRGNDELIELHDRLYSGVLAHHLLHECTFLPHLTVGRLSSRTSFLNALEIARKVEVGFQTVVAELTVYQVEGHPPIEFSIAL